MAETIKQLRQELLTLARESIEREKALVKLEAEVMYWRQAELEGRLAVLPCKVFGSVYQVVFGRIVEREVKSVEVYSGGKYRLVFGATVGAFSHDFGKTIFLTREEAEAAINR